MKKIHLVSMAVLAIMLIVVGCSSPAGDAQKMFDSGQYEQLIAKYGSDPAMSDLVKQAKEKAAETMCEAGKFADVVETYPETMAAKVAHSKLADQLFNEGKYDELLADYGDTPAAMKAKLEIEKAKSDSLTGVAEKTGAKLKDTQKEARAVLETAAKRELDRINAIKNPRLRKKALDEFIKNPKFKGTKAAKGAAKAE